jgi:CHASE2 domain-containing sensor protein
LVWPGWIKSAVKQINRAALPVGIISFILIAGAASWMRWCEIYELQAYDWRCQLVPASPPSDRILLIDIEDNTLNLIGRWPFDRQYHAVLLDALRESKARSAGLDILFVEPSASDADMTEAVRRFGKTFFCEAMEAPHAVKFGRPIAEKVIAPLLDTFRNASAGVAHVNVTPDPDGKRRRLMPVIWENGKPRFQLGLYLAMNSLGVAPEDVRFEPGWINLGGKVRIPVDEKGETLVSFHGKWLEAFNHVPYVSVLASYGQSLKNEKTDWDLNQLKDKVCLVGLTAVGTHDINAVPIDPLYPQVGIHADFFQNVMDGRFMVRLPRWVNLAVALLLSIISWNIARIRRLPLGVAAYLGGWVLFIGLNAALFVWGHRWLDLFYPSVLYWSIYLSATVWRTMQEKRKREMIEAELSIASRIQRSLLPSALPEVPGYEMDVYMLPAKHVGGDLYTALRLNETHLGIMCGDVSGKGIPAALFMARSVAEFKFCAAASGDDPALTLTKLNNSLAEGDSTSGLFVTMNYAVVDLAQKRFILSNGGHMPVLRIRAGGESDELNPDGGMPIGLMTDVEFGRVEVDLLPGDVFFMYTDGVSEARNRRVQDFEIGRMTEIAKRHRAEPAAAIREHILKGLREFVGTAPQHDDMTLLIFKVKLAD